MKLKILIVLMLFQSFSAYADMKHGKFTQHFENSYFKATENERFSVELILKNDENELKVGVNKLDIALHNEMDKDVAGAVITIVPWMPDMGHGVKTKPVVSDKGHGLYRTENVEFSMSGLWELRINIKKGSVEDNVVFTFPHIKRPGQHQHLVKKKPENIDKSISKMSENNIYHVSYESKLKPIRINKIHIWELTVKTTDSKSVEKAEIKIDGDMPEHGHGLPTQPVVTEYMGNGIYLVEGMKFNMPGWWIVEFTISAGNKNDKVNFNLDVR